MFCTKCGKPIIMGAKHCASCGEIAPSNQALGVSSMATDGVVLKGETNAKRAFAVKRGRCLFFGISGAIVMFFAIPVVAFTVGNRVWVGFTGNTI